MTIKEAVEIYNIKKEKIDQLKQVQKRIVSENSGYMKDPLGYFRVDNEDMNIFADLLSLRIKQLEAELQQEFK